MKDFSPPRDVALVLSDDDERFMRQVAFNMPASWEQMEALGLDPLTGERT